MIERQLFKVHASVLAMSGDRFWLVKEAKPEARDKWNLPGGHVEHGESLVGAAARELLEETGLTCPLSGLIGVYSTNQSVRFVFRANAGNQQARSGDEILGVGLFSATDVAEMEADELVAPEMLRQIVLDAWEGKNHPLDLVRHMVP